MFIPLFIAIWLGLVGPSDIHANPHNNGTVHISSNGELDDPGTPTDSIPGDGTGGDNGNVPPPKP